MFSLPCDSKRQGKSFSCGALVMLPRRQTPANVSITWSLVMRRILSPHSGSAGKSNLLDYVILAKQGEMMARVEPSDHLCSSWKCIYSLLKHTTYFILLAWI